MTDITGIVNLVLFVCLVVYLARLRATLTRSAEAQERIARAVERQAAEKDGVGAEFPGGTGSGRRAQDDPAPSRPAP
ncbi:hypothetical protein AB2L28_06375 [Kineococcus sp. TBRC 1896]|uniref:CcmD family protein n=1 Tax=Kineococcus mangrovi TaxID=1660183 RepID=A0ABV4I3T0_9ACTN